MMKVKKALITGITGQDGAYLADLLQKKGYSDLLPGDPSKAKAKLRWEAKTSLEELAGMMADADLKRV